MNATTRGCVLLAIVACGAFQALGAGSPISKWDAGTFKAMSETDRLEFAKELVRARDALLQNFSYDVLESMSSVSSDDGARRSFPPVRYSVKRLGRSEWMKLNQPGTGSNVGFDALTNWDGTRATSLTARPNRAEMRGMIRDEANTNFVYRAYNQILGFRVLEDGPPMTVAEWIGQFPKGDKKIDASVESRESVDLLKINVWDQYRHKTFWFDVARGMLMVRNEYHYQVLEGKGYNKEHSDVVEAKKIGGVWIPTKVVRRTGTSASRGEGEIVYEVKDFAVGTVKPEEIVITFPPGTTVLDEVSRVAYVIQADGMKKPIQFYDRETGALRLPQSAAEVREVKPGLYNPPTPVVVRANGSNTAGAAAPDRSIAVMPPQTHWMMTIVIAILAIAALLILLRFRMRSQ